VRNNGTVIGKQETTMNKSGSEDLRATLQEILAQLANLADRVSGLEQLASISGAEPAVPPPSDEVVAAVAEPAPTPPPVAVEAGITEEEVLAISAALAAWLGVHPHIRQIRLIRTGAWAQQGRVTIQASHRLNY
jgi:methylmalonyl-CoA carboxyltransferase large subunit